MERFRYFGCKRRVCLVDFCPVDFRIVVIMIVGFVTGMSFAYIVHNTGVFRSRSFGNFSDFVSLARSYWPSVGEDYHRPLILGVSAPAGTGNNSSSRQDGVRLLCWVMTMPANHQIKARQVRDTWGRRCDILLFMSSLEDPTIPTVAVRTEEGRNMLWAKTKASFLHVYDHYRDKADWFLKADDDTYVVVENLRCLLSGYSPQQPIYFGHRFKMFVKNGYMSGGAGYVLSSEALQRLATRGLRGGRGGAGVCKQSASGPEDVEMGRCLETLSVLPVDSRDQLGRNRFLPFNLAALIDSAKWPKNFWFWRYEYYSMQTGIQCCSQSTVTFHYVKPDQMRVLEYLLYTVKPSLQLR